MQLSREARLVAGLTLLTVPTIMYGGITLLGILTRGTVGLAPGGLTLDDTQWALFRAGHAHAGVGVQIAGAQRTTLCRPVCWTARGLSGPHHFRSNSSWMWTSVKLR